MELLTPIGLGFLLNFFLFFLAKLLKQSTKNVLIICSFTFLAVFFTSFLYGGWGGMGIAVISLGMLLFTLISAVIYFVRNKQ